jgi:hypothetical protein
MPSPDGLQALCEQGNDQLMRMDYIAAERSLVRAEELALASGDFETLARLYMPLQESRRQRRQRCGEGIVRLDLIARGPDDKSIDAREIVEKYLQGQLLVAGWGSIAPALELRRLQQERRLYVETFLAAVYPIDAGRALVIAPLEDVALPDARAAGSIDDLIKLLPAHSVVLNETELPRGQRPGDWKTYAEVMAMWERLHAPFLAEADHTVDPLAKIHAYRRTIRVDYACEFAHQRLADTAQRYARERRVGAGPH